VEGYGGIVSKYGNVLGSLLRLLSRDRFPSRVGIPEAIPGFPEYCRYLYVYI
jgi:hypothetical protein